jgi:hypothetical protein
MVFNTTYNNISIIIWRSLLLVEETAVTGKPIELTNRALLRQQIVHDEIHLLIFLHIHREHLFFD